jgi:hypothetical protein
MSFMKLKLRFYLKVPVPLYKLISMEEDQRFRAVSVTYSKADPDLKLV